MYIKWEIRNSGEIVLQTAQHHKNVTLLLLLHKFSFPAPWKERVNEIKWKFEIYIISSVLYLKFYFMQMSLLKMNYYSTIRLDWQTFFWKIKALWDKVCGEASSISKEITGGPRIPTTLSSIIPGYL